MRGDDGSGNGSCGGRWVGAVAVAVAVVVAVARVFPPFPCAPALVLLPIPFFKSSD